MAKEESIIDIAKRSFYQTIQAYVNGRTSINSVQQSFDSYAELRDEELKIYREIKEGTINEKDTKIRDLEKKIEFLKGPLFKIPRLIEDIKNEYQANLENPGSDYINPMKDPHKKDKK